jgi:ribosome-associated protein
MTETTAKKDVQKLQRAIVDGLEDVKAQDIVVFNTEHLSPLFERVMMASGTSNRQTKALAASVRDKVREAGFPKPRIEGEENGEWIIIDCGQAVVHVMQPAIRQYYHLEEIWGEKPVRLKLGAPKPMPAAASKPPAGQAESKSKSKSKPKSGKSSARAGTGASRPASAGAKGASSSSSSRPSRQPAAQRASSAPAAGKAAAPARSASPAKSTTKPAAKPAVKRSAKPAAKGAAPRKRPASSSASRSRKSPGA